MKAIAFAARFALWRLVQGCCRLCFTGPVMPCDLGLLFSAFFPPHLFLPLSSIAVTPSIFSRSILSFPVRLTSPYALYSASFNATLALLEKLVVARSAVYRRP
ncbi:hypothetical protein BDW67DRAFT_130180 [Aspergillus spinulosporus]